MDKGVYTYLKSVSPKENVIARIEFELAYFEVASTLAITPPELTNIQ